jgi:Trp operon repressor
MVADEFKQAIINAKKGDCIIYDEAVMGLSSAESITRIGRLLKSMMMQMRQKNLFVIIIIPAFFELNKYAVLGRAKGLFHIYEKNGKRGFFVGYNKEDMKKIYLKGRKNYAYCWRSFFNGKFFGKFAVDEAAYRKKKEEALFGLDVEKDEDMEKFGARNAIILGLKEKGYTQPEIISLIELGGGRITQGRISQIIGKQRKIVEKISY